MFWYLVVHADARGGCEPRRFHLLRRRRLPGRKVPLVRAAAAVEAQAIEPSPEIEGRRAGSERYAASVAVGDETGRSRGQFPRRRSRRGSRQRPPRSRRFECPVHSKTQRARQSNGQRRRNQSKECAPQKSV